MFLFKDERNFGFHAPLTFTMWSIVKFVFNYIRVVQKSPGRINRSVYSESQFTVSQYNRVMCQAEDHFITFVLLWGALKIFGMNGKLKVLHLPETGKI